MPFGQLPKQLWQDPNSVVLGSPAKTKQCRTAVDISIRSKKWHALQVSSDTVVWSSDLFEGKSQAEVSEIVRGKQDLPIGLRICVAMGLCIGDYWPHP
eukprot:2089711-Amphidinium_carterae.1